jgi:hypothetical protein
VQLLGAREAELAVLRALLRETRAALPRAETESAPGPASAPDSPPLGSPLSQLSSIAAASDDDSGSPRTRPARPAPARHSPARGARASARSDGPASGRNDRHARARSASSDASSPGAPAPPGAVIALQRKLREAKDEAAWLSAQARPRAPAPPRAPARAPGPRKPPWRRQRSLAVANVRPQRARPRRAALTFNHYLNNRGAAGCF